MHSLAKHLCLIIFAASVFSANAPAAPRIRAVQIIGQRYLLLRDVAAFYGMGYRADDEVAILKSQFSLLRFQEKKRAATINGVQVHLSHACAKWRRELAISETDFRLILEPILRSQTIKPRPIRRILIDPGHGGRDPGAQNRNTAEKEVTLAVARQLRQILTTQGYQVLMTRASDEAVSLSDRAAMARRYSVDLFISLHANAVGTGSVHGIETYLLSPQGTASTHGSTPKSDNSPGNAYDIENTRLAYEVQKSLLNATGANDRGTKHANFKVLRDVPCPAVLVEMGFLTNPQEAAKLVNPAYQRRLALAIAQGVRHFHRAVIE